MENPFFSESLEADALIEFHSEDIDFELENPPLVADWITNIIKAEDFQLQHLSFIFCSDPYLHHLNVQYLNHDTLTDIITFPYANPPLLEGDIFISIDRVEENAQTYHASFEGELHRVMAHGVLHLCGYSDKTPEDKTKMTEKENEALEKWRSMQPSQS
jgi:probable rRNA maturation factor